METRTLEIGGITFRAKVDMSGLNDDVLIDAIGSTQWQIVTHDELRYLVGWLNGLLPTTTPIGPKVMSGVTPAIRTALPVGPAQPLDLRKAESTVPLKQITHEQSTALAVGEAAFVDFSEGKPLPKGTVRQWDGGGK